MTGGHKAGPPAPPIARLAMGYAKYRVLKGFAFEKRYLLDMSMDIMQNFLDNVD